MDRLNIGIVIPAFNEEKTIVAAGIAASTKTALIT